MKRQARFVGTGHHGRRIEGLETGRSKAADENPVAIFPQHTSRNGDLQLHVRVLWLDKTKTICDGAGGRSISGCTGTGAQVRRWPPSRSSWGPTPRVGLGA